MCFHLKPREYLNINLIKNIKNSSEENFVTSVENLRNNQGQKKKRNNQGHGNFLL